MILETVKSDGLAHLSYLLGDDGAGVCAVIDPRRDVEVYLGLAQRYQLRITHVLETHIHADFVSGSRELAARTDATIYGGEGDYGFEIEALREGDTLSVGPFTLEVLHTPGHSPEHVCLVVRGGGKGAEEPWAVFTGDTLFASEVGRPDLATGKSEEELARDLYSSLKKLLGLPETLEVLPAHGEGSPCGGSIGVRDRTTLGYEKAHNAKLQLSSEAEFTEQVLAELSPEPRYYPRMKRLNARGPEPLGSRPHLSALSPEQVDDLRQQEDVLFLDTREIDAFAGAHIGGSLNIALRSSFPIWCGWMLDSEQRLVLISEDSAAAARAQTHLLRTGFDKVIGYLRGGMRTWTEARREFETSGRMSVHDLNAKVEAGDVGQLLDVRREDEWQAGFIPGAQHIFLPFLAEHIETLDQERPVTVYCGSGYRASIAVSLLERRGFREVTNVLGSMKAWRAAGLDTVKE